MRTCGECEYWHPFIAPAVDDPFGFDGKCIGRRSVHHNTRRHSHWSAPEDCFVPIQEPTESTEGGR